MKTEVKFRELPEKVQVFLLSSRVTDNDWADSDTVKLDWLHTLPEWKDATDEERLAYAEWRYKDGMTVKCTYDNTVVNISDLTIFKVQSQPKYFCVNDKNLCLYNGHINKWAEIISEPEEKQSIKDRLKGTCVKSESAEMGAEIVALYVEAGFDNSMHHWRGVEIGFYYGENNGLVDCSQSGQFFTTVITRDQLRQIVIGVDIKEASPESQQEFVKANPGMRHVEEFESGKIVNVWNREDKMDFQPAKYRFFADGKHWVETCSADLVVNFKNTEKTANTDLKEIEEPKSGDMVEYCPNRIAWEKGIYIAKWKEKFIVENKFGDVSEVYGIRLPQKSEVESKAKELMKVYDWTSDDLAYDETLKMLIEIAKWGQANPDKI